MKKIAIYVFNNVEELGLDIVYNILKKTKILKNRGILPIDQPLDVELISDKHLVIGTKDMQITPHQVGLDFDDYDILIIPGGKGINTIIQNQKILDKVKIFGQEKLICTIGLGSIVLAHAGLLKNKKATTHHKHFHRLQEFCKVENKRVVVSDNLITAGGMLCAVDLAEAIIERCYSKSIADIILEYVEAHRKSKGIRIILGEIDEE
ncbi:MAG: DJ-1/PfpI family protein [Candidatus Heimdallarchaeota archaeon]|nr:DJ-1/PfpI family protein [Candidatus Heimdallarchaeota archaeon]MCK4253761.1 DJ-1/PfpI family protein [Candidatus Heimdallarchaeota archaeon]